MDNLLDTVSVVTVASGFGSLQTVEDIQLNPSDNTNILFYSSLIFITNICTTFYKHYYLYSSLFFMLTISIVVYGSFVLYNKNNIKYLDWRDPKPKATVVSDGNPKVVAEGFRFKSLVNSRRIHYYTYIVVFTFLFVVYLYAYGYIITNYCFHPQIYTADKYHSLIHILSSFGHHLITFL